MKLKNQDYFASPEIIWVEICNRQTDRQTDRQTNTLTPYKGVCGFFLQVKFPISLLASLARDKIVHSLASYF